MGTIPVEVGCCLCSEKIKVEIPAPDGWTCGEYDFDVENALCPKHAIIEKFKQSQCIGCVSEWCDCSLWNGFAYTGRRDVTEADLDQLRRGVCPRRTNGTFGVDMGKRQIEKIDLSEQAPADAGNALADAILDYWREYP